MYYSWSGSSNYSSIIFNDNGLNKSTANDVSPVTMITFDFNNNRRTKQCNKEIRSNHHTQCCGCPNMMTVIEDKSVVQNSLVRSVHHFLRSLWYNHRRKWVVVLNGFEIDDGSRTLSQSDLSFQEERRKRKVRKLDFDVR